MIASRLSPGGGHGREAQPRERAHHRAEGAGRLAGDALRARASRTRISASRRSASPRCGTTATRATCTSGSSPRRCSEGARAAGLVGLRFFTIGVSDGISMGTEGMSYSLQSRDLIADSIETVMARAVVRRERLDPGLRQEHARLRDRDGAPEPPGADGLRRHDRGRAERQRASRIDIIAAFQSYGEFARGAHRRRTSALDVDAPRLPGRGRLRRHVHREHDGVGDRGARHVAARTARRRPPETRRSSPSAARAGAAIRHLLELDLKPRDIMTREAFENAMVMGIALGGSTNLVLHLIAMARSVGIRLGLDDFQRGERQDAAPRRLQAERPLRDGGPARASAARRR